MEADLRGVRDTAADGDKDLVPDADGVAIDALAEFDTAADKLALVEDVATPDLLDVPDTSEVKLSRGEAVATVETIDDAESKDDAVADWVKTLRDGVAVFAGDAEDAADAVVVSDTTTLEVMVDDTDVDVVRAAVAEFVDDTDCEEDTIALEVADEDICALMEAALDAVDVGVIDAVVTEVAESNDETVATLEWDSADDIVDDGDSKPVSVADSDVSGDTDGPPDMLTAPEEDAERELGALAEVDAVMEFVFDEVSEDS